MQSIIPDVLRTLGYPNVGIRTGQLVTLIGNLEMDTCAVIYDVQCVDMVRFGMCETDTDGDRCVITI